MTYFPLTNKKIGSLAVGLCLAGTICLPAEAVLTRYSFNSSSAFSDGGSLSGYFDYDLAVPNTYLSYSISVTTGTNSNFTSFTYTPFNSTVSGASGEGFTVNQDGLSPGSRYLALAFPALTDANTTLNTSILPYTTASNEFISTDGLSANFRGVTSNLTVTSSPVGVPLESDALSVMVAGTFLSGAYWLKRRRSAKSLAELSLSDGENN